MRRRPQSCWGFAVPSGLNLYEMVRNVVNEKSVRLPDEVIDGRKANVFRVECERAGPQASPRSHASR